MALGKQAKILTKGQVDSLTAFLLTRRHGIRDQTVFLLSVRAGLRAKEVANLRWAMVLTPEGEVGNAIHLTDNASKGRSGRVIPLNKQLRLNLVKLLEVAKQGRGFDFEKSYVITTERSAQTSPQAVVNMFKRWYNDVGLLGCSSHSGRRTFITNAARKISTVGGSLRDVQMLAGHASLAVTQRYIEGDSEARQKIVDLI
ncbi:tyrosine-type recombinase/integrase [Thalassobacter stenotrophicus]|uniref:Tyrosine recombinase XerC n=2 Tax=Thalassobacter stenotrophicus TaxID=266809 RepID=A0A0P1FNW7_9RHOB|nr:site-specific integrase [Thalassobacter stenotrophicus]CUH60903.1 Tyrosine recombinase XerC [Thalassobacter stenotrophicus]SHI52090.1 integrase/recombinase XerD [Thalassobacter stenotrophicus DSM 16310]